MQGSTAALLAAVIVIIILIAAAFVWFHFTGWQTFSYQTGDSPNWLPAGAADVSRLRFKDCVFTVARGDGVVKSQDVAPVLNGMAVAYAGGTNNPPSLTLTRPLNPFSFVIPGFNDRATVSDPTAPPWCTAPPPACSEDSTCPMPVRGACKTCASDSCATPSGTCSPACAAGQACVDGACVTPGTCSPACPRGKICLPSTCTPPGVCFSCEGGAKVTFAGKWRTI